MRSITARYTALVVVAIMLAVVVVGSICIVALRDTADRDAATIINLTCEDEADKINATFAQVEQAVDLEVAYALDRLDSVDSFFDDEDYRKAFTDQVERVFYDVAENTSGAITFYFRYNAQEIDSTQGFLYRRDNPDSRLEEIPLTDMSLYDPSDDEHVGWYYIPLRNGTPSWLIPYHNKNLDIYMISYVVPVFSEGRFIGVIGMDVNFDVVVSQLSEIHLFNTGYAALVGRDGTVYYHPELEYGSHLDGSQPELPDIKAYLTNADNGEDLITYQYEGKTKRMAFQALVNDMDLALVAQADDIDAGRNRLLVRLVIAAILIMALFIALAIASGWLLLRPLRDLTDAAQQVSEGNLDVKLPEGRSSEVATLIGAYSSTVDRMRDQMARIEELAHRDGLTRLWNKTSYDERIAELDGRIEEGDARFAIAMVDVNDLKTVNDVLGHEQGDRLLCGAVDAIVRVFGKGNLYRVGGDEFVIIAEDADADAADKAIEDLKAACGACKAYDPADSEPYISLACGIAHFTPGEDDDAASVFRRADSAMYEHKRAMKKSRL